MFEENLRPIDLNIVGADEYVHDVERSIRKTKDRVRSTVHGLPYKRYPRIMTVKLVGNTMRNLNQLPALNGISEYMIPLAIITGRKMVSYRKMRASFGAPGTRKCRQNKHYKPTDGRCHSARHVRESQWLL